MARFRVVMFRFPYLAPLVLFAVGIAAMVWGYFGPTYAYLGVKSFLIVNPVQAVGLMTILGALILFMVEWNRRNLAT